MKPDDPRHGTYAGSTAHYKSGEKPCEPCYAARRRYHTRYSKERQLGYVRRVKAGHGGIWDHLDALNRCGYSYRRLATIIGGLGEARLFVIHRAGPQGLISVDTWRRLNRTLLPIEPGPTQIGTLRRLQALHALGWPIKHVMDQTGHTPEIGKRALRGEHINFSLDVRKSIADVYDRLSMTLPPAASKGVRAAVERARRRSSTMGWLPPLAWDDIDDPDEQPTDWQYVAIGPQNVYAARDIDPVVVMRLLEGARVTANTAEKEAAVVQWVTDGGTEAELCRWHGWKPGRYTAGLRLVRGGAA